METLVNPELEAYARAHSIPEPALLAELSEATRKETEWPGMLVGPLEGGFLHLLTRIAGARRVLEIGTFTGYSALWLASALPPDGRVTTLDVSPEWTAIARRFWSRSEHGRKIELRLGPAAETLERLEGPFDLVFIDADKENYVRYWDACMPLVRAGGVLVADNTLWEGEVLDPQGEDAVAIAAFNRHVAKDPRVEAVLVPIRDGVTVAWKR